MTEQIHVDEDWKDRAEKEKQSDEERVREQIEKEFQAQNPQADFMSFVSGLATQSLMQMGVMKAQGMDDLPVDLMQARYLIDILQMIEEKTKGNLSDDESRNLADLLHQIRMVFVEVKEKGVPQTDSNAGQEKGSIILE